jgi:hypothetical protein
MAQLLHKRGKHEDTDGIDVYSLTGSASKYGPYAHYCSIQSHFKYITPLI